MIPHEYIEELTRRTDIVELVGSYVQLKRKGRLYGGLCPFHSEKSPSFYVYPDTQSFYCFGCGAGGDAITFAKKINSIDYPEAVKMLAARAGMPEPQEDDKTGRMRSRILSMNKEAARFFHACLNSAVEEARQARAYWRRRGLDDKTIVRFGLGYAPNDGQALYQFLRDKGYNQQELDASGLFKRSPSGRIYCLFWKRVMTPIFDLRGNIIAFGGRVLDDSKPKYVNSPETLVYHKSDTVFALQIAKRSASRRFVLCEGYMDVISLHKAGIENAIASLGTALTAEQARIIARYAKEVVICYDSDEAGQKAAQRAIPILRGAGLLVRVMAVPGNKDPDEFINACGDEGAARFRRLVEQSGNDVEYRLAKLKSGYDLSNENGRIQYLMAAVELLAGLENAIERDVYVSRLSQELNVDKNAILQQMSVSVRKKARAAQRQQQRDMTEQLSARRDTVNPEKRRYVRVANAEERLIACLFHNNDLAQSLNRRVPPEKFVTAFNRRLYQSLLGKIINEETVTSPQITDFSAECTPDEMGRLAKIVQENAGITAKDAEEYVQIILSEGALTDTDKVRGANPADLQAQLDALRKQKK